MITDAVGGEPRRVLPAGQVAEASSPMDIGDAMGVATVTVHTVFLVSPGSAWTSVRSNPACVDLGGCHAEHLNDASFLLRRPCQDNR